MPDTATQTSQLADRLRSEIGRIYKPGSSLPSVGAMTGRYGMTYGVVRAALHLLCQEKVIVCRPQVGHFVPDVENKHAGPLDFSSATPLHQQITDDLREKITGGTYGTGERIPGLRILSIHYGVSVMPVRQATDELVREGLLTIRARSGTFVTPQEN